LDGMPSNGGGPFATLAARPADLPKLGANDSHNAVVIRPSSTEPGTLAQEPMPNQASRTATPTHVQ
ncbi:hypothetical protein, partial [Achromobacter xylosoxidans]